MKRFQELESLRGASALLVVLFHLPGWHPTLYALSLVRNGYLMVDLFFVLSGFVIYLNYADRLATGADVLRFQGLRIGRLYPVHLAALLVYLAFEFGKLFLARRMGVNSPNSTPFVQNSWGAFVEQLLLVQAIGPTGHESSFNGPAWSISVEFYMYLVFAGFVLIVKRWRSVLTALISLAALAALASGSLSDFSSVLRCLAGFFAGCSIASLSQLRQSNAPRWMGWCGAVSLLAFLQFKSDPRFDVLAVPLSAILIACLVATPLPVRGSVNRVLLHPALAWLGTRSYSLYMCHAAVIWVFSQFFRVVVKRPEAMMSGLMVPQLTLAAGVAVDATIVATSLGIASVTYRLIEAPARQWSRAVLRPGPDCVSPAAATARQSVS